MSVILGKTTKDIVILAADKRLMNLIKNEVASDNADKLIIVNEHLAIACAGNAAIQKAIEIELEKLVSKEQLFVEDIIEVISEFYGRIKSVKAETLLSTSAFFIIGGLNRKDNIELISCSYNQRQLKFSKSEEIALYPPSDVEMGTCTEIYINNLYKYPEIFVEKTVKEISELSTVVSKCGDKWVYDNRSKLSRKSYFD